MSKDTSKDMQEPKNFEEAIQSLEVIVTQLEKGELPLDDALSAFKQGVALSQYCQNTLQNAEETVAKMMTSQGERPLDEV